MVRKTEKLEFFLNFILFFKAVFGFQLMLTIIVLSLLNKLSIRYSFARWLLTKGYEDLMAFFNVEHIDLFFLFYDYLVVYFYISIRVMSS